MNKMGRYTSHVVLSLFSLSLVAGCVSGDTPTEKFHARMRAKAIPPSDFLPNHELLVKQADHFPFHYFYLKKKVSDYQYVYIAPVDATRIIVSKGWSQVQKKAIEATGKNLDKLCDFTRKAFEQAFRKQMKAKGVTDRLVVTDRKDLPNTLIIEPAFIAIAPTKAELNIIGTTASFFVFGTDIVAGLLASGSVDMECRIRDAQTGEIVAMFADTEGDPNALLPVSGYSWTAATRINVKEIARHTAVLLSAEDYRVIRRKFPVKIISRLKDADLDKE